MPRLITVGRRFQGPTGSGQGGYTAALAGAGLGTQFRADFHRRIRLDTPLEVRVTGPGTREVRDGDDLIMRLAATDVNIRTPEPVGVATAEAGRRAYPAVGPEMVPYCFSCGIGDGSFRVWAGPIDDGTYYATPWWPPVWTAPAGAVDPAYVWAAIDCPAGAKACMDSDPPRTALTGSMTAEVLAPVAAETNHVIVAWADSWKGRRRVSGAALFTADGSLLARQESTWIALR